MGVCMKKLWPWRRAEMALPKVPKPKSSHAIPDEPVVTPKIRHARKLDLGPNDTLVLLADMRLSQAQREALRAECNEAFKLDDEQRVVVLDGGLDIEVLRKVSNTVNLEVVDALFTKGETKALKDKLKEELLRDERRAAR